MATFKHPIIEQDRVNSVSTTADVARYPWPGPRMFCSIVAERRPKAARARLRAAAIRLSSSILATTSFARIVVGGNLSRPSRRRQTTSTGLSPITVPPSAFIQQRPSITSSLGRTRNLSEFSTNICFCTQSRCKSLFSSSSTAAPISCRVRLGCGLRETVH